jgi:hypothetical protein
MSCRALPIGKAPIQLVQLCIQLLSTPLYCCDCPLLLLAVRVCSYEQSCAINVLGMAACRQQSSGAAAVDVELS